MSPDQSGTPVAVAFCPHPPALLPGHAGARALATDRLRIACGEALQTVLGLRPDVVLVVGEGPSGVRWGAGDAADLAQWGGAGMLPFAGRVRPGGRRLPLAHAVGARLLDEAGHTGTRLGVTPDDLAEALTDLPGPVGVLALGDGASPGARPGAPDARVADPEAAQVRTDGAPVADLGAVVATALVTGDAAALAGLDRAGGHGAGGDGGGVGRATVGGTRTWAAVGRVLAGRSITARLLLDGTPLGAGHLVADWLLADVPDGVPGWMQS